MGGGPPRLWNQPGRLGCPARRAGARRWGQFKASHHDSRGNVVDSVGLFIDSVSHRPTTDTIPVQPRCFTRRRTKLERQPGRQGAADLSWPEPAIIPVLVDHHRPVYVLVSDHARFATARLPGVARSSLTSLAGLSSRRATNFGCRVARDRAGPGLLRHPVALGRPKPPTSVTFEVVL